ncbi:signal peptidase I [Marinicella meishanensis]|uniref:signal peptidase I n=1 Tax=Marinicella meishanensis TaxID=2873263 RepID=UPI001CBC69B4|nr:signal peptidase I [Marinicella sp. NBU2979]
MHDFHWDYEVFLFLATLLTLGAWLLAKFKKHRSKQANKATWLSRTAAVGSFFPILFLVLSVRSFAFEPFRIPSSSMMPTLLTGDFIYVDKTAYGLKMPVFHNTLIETGHPQRGDVFVFRSVEDPAVDVIKRVIGVPGDHIRYDERSKQVWLNGAPLALQGDGFYQGFLDEIPGTGLRQNQATTGAASHVVLLSDVVRRSYPHTDLVVPEGHYFGMGDNRDFSVDSRVFGLIPEQNIVGKAQFVWMHWRPDDFWQGLKRIGHRL